MGTLLSSRGGSGPGTNRFQFTNDNASALIICQPVYSSSAGGGDLGVADTSGKSVLLGLVADTSIAPDETGDGVSAGVVVATTEQWDAVCGTSGGLTYGTIYYLHTTIAGRLSSYAPTSPADDGKEVVPVIVALSATEARICIQLPVPLN